MRRLFDILWLLAFAVYVLAGMMLATFHGDEPMQIYMSHDYATAFIYREPQRLTTSPPYDIDTDPQLRLLNGSINRYMIGVSWHLAGMTDGDLPPAPGWDWGLSYARNEETDHRPSDALLFAGRLSSTIFLALSVVVMFGIGWQFGGRPLAYLVSGLYAVNPVILLNGRRAMMEGSLLFFGLLTILISIIIVRRHEQNARRLWLWWICLILASGLALTSKHSGVVFVGSAFGWIFVAELTQRNWRDLLITVVKLVISTIAVFAIFIVLSPALWNDPLGRLGNLVAERQRLIDIQVEVDPLAPTTLTQRIESIITQPFLKPLAHYEVAYWADAEPITLEINRYMASPLSGLQFSLLLGLPLTLLAGLGIVSVLWSIQQSWKLGILVWFGITIASLLVNPLPWQRYYLPLLPIATLLAGTGLMTVVRLFVQKREQNLPQSPLPVSSP